MIKFWLAKAFVELLPYIIMFVIVIIGGIIIWLKGENK